MHRTPHHWTARIAPPLAAAGMGLGALVVVGPAPVDAGGKTVVVRPDESIQAAIDAASPNTTIVVAGGVHAEQLTISTDRITLVGRDTELIPPPTAEPNECSGLVGTVGEDGPPTEAGICIIGTDVTFLPSESVPAPVDTVGRHVRSVRVKGFAIAGFSGPHVAVVGGRDVRVEDNDLTDTSSYGVLSLGSRHTRITNDRITGPPLPGLGVIGICVYDQASPVVTRNDVSRQVIGICVQTSGAEVTRNSVHDGCVGMYVDPGVGATITHNHVFDNNECDLTGYNYGRGVMLAGARGTVVKHNVIEGHTAADGLPAVLVTDDVGTGNVGTGTVASDNVIAHNTIVDNSLDLVSRATGRNRIARNVCATSVPSDLCD